MLSLLINDKLYTEEFYILECLSFEVILGCQFLRVHEATINLRIDKAEVKFVESKLLPQKSEMCVASIEDAYIPPFSQKFVKCKIKDIDLDTYEILPIENLFIKKGLLVARGIIEISSEILVVLVANTTKCCISLTENEEVCQLTKWETENQKLTTITIGEGAEEPTPAECIHHELQSNLEDLKKNLQDLSQSWISNGAGCRRMNQKKHVNY